MSVGTATRYELASNPGGCRNFRTLPDRPWGPSFCTTGTGSLSWGQSDRGVELTTHHHLRLMLKKAYLDSPFVLLWQVIEWTLPFLPFKIIHLRAVYVKLFETGYYSENRSRIPGYAGVYLVTSAFRTIGLARTFTLNSFLDGGVKRQGCEAQHSLLPAVEFK